MKNTMQNISCLNFPHNIMGKNRLFFLIFLSANLTDFWGFTTLFRGIYRQLNMSSYRVAHSAIIKITGLSLQSQMELLI